MTAPSSTAPALAPTDSSRSSHHWWILVTLGLAQLMLVLDLTVVNIALPSAQTALHFSNADRQWIVTAYALTFGGLLLFGGRLGDVVGRKRVFLAGIVGFATVSAIGGASTGFTMLVIARAAQGCFGAILAPAALSLLTTTFTNPKERAEAFGIFGAIAGAGGAMGLLLGGVLTEYLNWRWCLYVNIIFAVAAGIGGMVFIHDERRSESAGLDLPGAVCSIAGLVALVYGFSEADTKSWSSPVTISLLVASVVLLAGFAWWQTRAPNALLPLRIVRDRGRGGANLSVLLVGVAMFGVFLFLTYYLQETLRFSPVKTGLGFLPMLGMVMVTATSSGMVLLRRTGPRPLIVGGMLIAAVGMILMSQLAVHSTYAAHVLPALLVVGLGMGFIFGAAMNVATAGADPADAGVASALPNVAQQIGGALGPALLNTIATGAATSYLAGKAVTPALEAAASVHGDRMAFTVVYIILFASAVVAFFVLPRGSVAVGDGPPALG